MKSRKLSIIFALVVLFNAIFAGFAFAEETAPPTQNKLNIVAFGDSITHGYPNPSLTFADYIADECTNVTKIGRSGLAAMNVLEEPVLLGSLSLKAKQADVVTVTIGSNDFMAATGLKSLFEALQPYLVDQVKLQTALADGTINNIFAQNQVTEITNEQLVGYVSALQAIVTAAKTSDDAPIIVYNLYNPIVVNPQLDAALNGKLTELHNFVDSELAKVNSEISGIGNLNNDVYVVDAKATIGSNPAAFIAQNDIHPTVAGHKALAKLADNVINSLPAEEPDEDKNPCGNCNNDPVEEPEGCPQTPPNEEEPPVEEPGENPGEQPGENPPTDGPKENPTPQPPAAEQPKAETPKPIPVKAQAKVLTSGSELPDTATPIYNYLVIGLALAFVGMISFGIQQYHQKRNESI